MTDTITYSKLISIILKVLNQFRENPKMLIPVLEQRSKKYQGKNYMPTNDYCLMIKTEEGIVPVTDLIDQLRMLPKYNKLNWSFELHQAANHRAQKIAYSYTHTEKINNIESQNQNLEDLVSSFADWNGSLSQHILYGFCDPLDILCQLLIDDGNLERQNRRQFLSPELHDIGIGIQKHEKYQFVVVIIMATKAEKINKKYIISHRHKEEERQPFVAHQQQQSDFCHGCSIC